MGVFGCLVDLKVAGIAKGLTWVSDHARVTFPEFQPDVFSLGALASITNSTADDDFLANPATSTTDEVTNALVKVGKKLEAVIRQEALISTALVILYFIIVLIGFISVVVSVLEKDKSRAEGGSGPNTLYPRPNVEAHHTNVPEIVTEKFGQDAHGNTGWHQEHMVTGLRMPFASYGASDDLSYNVAPAPTYEASITPVATGSERLGVVPSGRVNRGPWVKDEKEREFWQADDVQLRATSSYGHLEGEDEKAIGWGGMVNGSGNGGLMIPPKRI
ncbi:hypothetical protein DID88_009175 [Monilinia fructigena]|uniref:Plasma membrane fusion protein PRM1 n=1 Tax=Monilinia fructigena TaxID=38457 RepID=A0A395IEY0_9HELO|nr:hypothetical protein DID88_009175 [Monilinia fructigena]